MNDIPLPVANHVFETFLIQASPEEIEASLYDFMTSLITNERFRTYRDGQSIFLEMDNNNLIEIIVQVRSDERLRMLSFKPNSAPHSEILFICRYVAESTDADEILNSIRTYVLEQAGSFSDLENQSILDSMPLLMEFSSRAEYRVFSDFALIWRDHYLEENVALLQAFERAGIDARWILALAKGDATPKRWRIAEHFQRRGYRIGVLDNALFSAEKHTHIELTRNISLIEGFVEDARASGRHIMLIDDGAIVPKCFSSNQDLFDLALELTIPGIKRLLDLQHLDIPVYDLANSILKQTITYPEIAESCVNRIRELLSSEKFIGRAVAVLGYGSAGRHVARILRSTGCRVAVVDTNMMRLIEAAEGGFLTFRSTKAALRQFEPFLVIGCAGDVSLSHTDIEYLPDGCYVTGIATLDLAELKKHSSQFPAKQIPYFGSEHSNTHGKHFFQIGDGRSINLFESEAIPNRANDVFKTSIFVAARDICNQFSNLAGGLYVTEVDNAIERSGLLERYYDLYLQTARQDLLP